MERESNSMQALCRSGCGFYGNPATDGLCSICYKEIVKKKNQPPTNTPSSAVYTSHSSQSTDTAMPTIPSIIQSSFPTTCSAAAQVSSAMSTTAQNAAAAASNSSSNLVDGSSIASDSQDKESEESGNSISAEAASNSSDNSKDDKDESKNKKKNRCVMCRKKVGLTGFQCRCEGLFCAIHRYSDKHNCSFDYRELGAQEIRRNNPVVVGEKIQKI